MESGRAFLAGGALRQQRVPKSVNSLAVLPFKNTSGDPDNEYLCDGITGCLINVLATLPKTESDGAKHCISVQRPGD